MKALIYLWPEMFYHQPGLGHMSAIAKTLSLESSLSGRIGLLPPLLSSSEHNPGSKRRLSWERYFAFDDLPIIDPGFSARNEIQSLLATNMNTLLYGNHSFEELLNSTRSVVARWFPRPSIYGQWLPSEQSELHLKTHNLGQRFPISVQEIASQIISEIGSPEGVLHVRRGDMACPKTSPPMVLEYLESKGANKYDLIYLMTNESDPSYIKALKSVYPKLIWEKEIDCVRKSRQLKSDNYLLFRVGKYIQSRHDQLMLDTLRYPDLARMSMQQRSLYSRILVKIEDHFSAVRLNHLKKATSVALFC